MLEGHNPHWKLLQTDDDNRREDRIPDYMDYSEIDKQLRLVTVSLFSSYYCIHAHYFVYLGWS